MYYNYTAGKPGLQEGCLASVENLKNVSNAYYNMNKTYIKSSY